MFAGDWSYGDPRESETVGQRRQRKNGGREGSVHTNSSSGEKNIQRPITPSSFFTGGPHFNYNHAPIHKPKPNNTPFNSNTISNNKNKSGTYIDMGGRAEKLERAPSSTASTTKGKSSVFNIFGKRNKHERNPSINEIVPRKASEAEQNISSKRSGSSSSGSKVKPAGTNSMDNKSIEKGKPNNGFAPNDRASVNNGNAAGIANNAGASGRCASDAGDPTLHFPMPPATQSVQSRQPSIVSSEHYHRPPAPPPNVPIPPTPDGKMHGHFEQGSISDQSTLVTPNRRSDVPSEFVESQSHRKFNPPESPVDLSAFPMPRNYNNRNGMLSRNGSNRILNRPSIENIDDGDDYSFDLRPSRRLSPQGFHNHPGSRKSANEPNRVKTGGSEIPSARSMLEESLEAMSITERDIKHKYRNDLQTPFGSPTGGTSLHNRNSFIGNKNVKAGTYFAANDQYSSLGGNDYSASNAGQGARGPSRTGGEFKNVSIESGSLSRKSFRQAFHKMESAGLKIIFKRLTEDWTANSEVPIDEDLLEEVTFEKKVWALIGTRWLTFGRLLVGPAQKLLCNAKEEEGRRLLSLHGTAADGWVLAANFPEVMVYSVSAQDISRPVCSWSPPLNHHSLFQQMVTPVLPFPDNYFDVICSKTVTSLFTDNQWVPMLKECYRVLRPGGWLEIQTIDPVLTKQGELLKRWTNTKLLVELMEDGFSARPTEDIMEYFGEAGFSDVKRSRIQLPAIPKRAHRGNGAGSQRDMDGNKISVFVGRHIYEDLYQGFLPINPETGQQERFWWNTSRQIKNECESKETAFDMNTIFGQKLV